MMRDYNQKCDITHFKDRVLDRNWWFVNIIFRFDKKGIFTIKLVEISEEALKCRRRIKHLYLLNLSYLLLGAFITFKVILSSFHFYIMSCTFCSCIMKIEVRRYGIARVILPKNSYAFWFLFYKNYYWL